ncbi:hypothetical protein [Haloterrigena salifodinae]|uniref:Uncharacterized protein n=1 Tax=Haloterrigena salifodinae TaxID=2675099 RepID=A0A8T8E743_9EURY|nr:hypothetical protein [Haloterrigena salifodinae]QRV17529.1 hypothetical protein JMJ58_22120 [Haloterrigena salifodinae]
MEAETIFRAATLWFIVVIYFNMESGMAKPPFADLVDLVGLLLFVLLPIYVLIEAGTTLVKKYPVEADQGENPR